MTEIKFVPPWEKYKAVAKLVREGDVEGALKKTRAIMA